MKNKLLALLAAAVMTVSLVACGGQAYGPDEEDVELTLPSSVTAFELDDTDYDSLTDAETDTIRVFYRRNDNNETYSNYARWRIWAWDTNGGTGWWYEFTKYNAYGVICDIPVSAVAADKTSIDNIGIVITTCQSTGATWEGTFSKDPDTDLFGEISASNPGGIQRLYAKSSTARLFYTQSSVFMSTISTVRYVDKRTLYVLFDTSKADFKLYAPRFDIKINGVAETAFTMKDAITKKVANVIFAECNLVFKKDVLIRDIVDVGYKFSANFTDRSGMILTKYFDTDEFVSEYSYTGDDLGVSFVGSETMPSGTTFKLWSPVSSTVTLNIYNSGDYVGDLTPANSYSMTLGENGVWAHTVNSDLSNKYYTYTVVNSMGTNEVVDPYAKSAGLNGKRGMVVNFATLNAGITGWNLDTRPEYGENGTDASIYEIHVRDMTINPNSGVSAANRGKFLGLAETGTVYQEGTTTVTTGLDHMQELGITHVQIQPFYDFSSIDESTLDTSMGTDNYNWGYDPLNYNALEGSYSTDPSDGAVRIREFKEMVMAMHQAGININMDVVYNHTASFANSNFEKIMPYYYHRTKSAGVPYNGSGCGNEMASERFMVNKFVRESCKFWIDEYHLSGFRFDLMGLMDNQIMIDIYQDCSALYDDILIYGEPWTGGTSKLKGGTSSTALLSQQTVQSSLAQSYFAGAGNYVGAFNDVIRNAVRGDNAPGLGWVGGLNGNASSILPGIEGVFSSSLKTIEPEQVLNYVSCHDNYTLYDQLIQKVSNSRNFPDVYSQSEMVVFTAQGVPFMQEGEDFMRTKAYIDGDKTKYSGNSYNVGDLINNMDYALKLDNLSMFEWFKDLIAFRKATSQLTLSTRAAINSAISGLSANATSGLISYHLTTADGGLYVLHALNNGTIPLGSNYQLLFSNNSSLVPGTNYSSIQLSANNSVVLKKV
ncbi:MAG TPA: type I pullulanase [Bacilli bacterium]|nr:type I pullulanase [Bacilli bacterium]